MNFRARMISVYLAKAQAVRIQTHVKMEPCFTQRHVKMEPCFTQRVSATLAGPKTPFERASYGLIYSKVHPTKFKFKSLEYKLYLEHVAEHMFSFLVTHEIYERYFPIMQLQTLHMSLQCRGTRFITTGYLHFVGAHLEEEQFTYLLQQVLLDQK